MRKRTQSFLSVPCFRDSCVRLAEPQQMCPVQGRPWGFARLADFQGLLILCPQQLFPSPAPLCRTLVRNVQSHFLRTPAECGVKGGRVLPIVGQRAVFVPSYLPSNQGHRVERQ